MVIVTYNVPCNKPAPNKLELIIINLKQFLLIELKNQIPLTTHKNSSSTFEQNLNISVFATHSLQQIRHVEWRIY